MLYTRRSLGLAVFLFFAVNLGTSGVRADEVTGFADTHNHWMAEYAFGGAWFHGSTEGRERDAMHACSGGVFNRDHARVSIPGLAEFMGMIKGTDGDTGWHLGKRGGYPNYEGWPRWDTIAHQQMWEGFLKEAHDEGMTLMLASAVNFEPMCRLMPKKNRSYGCNDMDAVHRQITAMERFVKNHDWARIVRTPEEARTAIEAGKLAIVIAVEVSDLFARGNWVAQLAELYHRGVRSIQVVHQLDNRFGGAAPHHFIFKIFEFLRSFKNIDELSDLDPTMWGFELDKDGHNKRGLTSEGRLLVSKMMDLGMLIDLAHLSERGVREVDTIAKARGGYPLFVSHGHFRDMMADDKGHHEKASPPWILNLVRDSGGVFGLRTGPEKVHTYAGSHVKNDCDGSSKSFAQVYERLTQEYGMSIAFGSDFNGFIQQLRPRFGDDRETCGAASSNSKQRDQRRAQKQMLGRAFDRSGLGHIGQLGDVVAELKNFGVDTSALERSSEAVIRMWEKSLRRPEPELAPYRGLASTPEN